MDLKEQRDNSKGDCRETATGERLTCLQVDDMAPSCSSSFQDHFTLSDANVDPEAKEIAGAMGIATQRGRLKGNGILC